jgi:hypothetical protein
VHWYLGALLAAGGRACHPVGASLAHSEQAVLRKACTSSIFISYASNNAFILVLVEDVWS